MSNSLDSNPKDYLAWVKEAKASRPCSRLVGTSGPAHYLSCSVCSKPHTSPSIKPKPFTKPSLFTKGESSTKKPSLF